MSRPATPRPPRSARLEALREALRPTASEQEVEAMRIAAAGAEHEDGLAFDEDAYDDGAYDGRGAP